MNKTVVRIFIFSLLLIVLGQLIVRANISYSSHPPVFIPSYQIPEDTIKPRYPVKKTTEENFEDYKRTTTLDLKRPDNINTSILYDPNTSFYIFRTKIGDVDINTPFSMSSDAYRKYSLDKSMAEYFKLKNSLAEEQKKDSKFSLKNIKVHTSPLDRIFGPGGVKVNSSGYVEGTVGFKRTTDKNPMLPTNRRTKTIFVFDEDIQLNVDATVGDKINFDMSYDTQSMFDFDSKRIRLAYDASKSGDEDAILRKIEAGNVSMYTTNSLISGKSALFGISTELQFGKLRINTIISQQESEARVARTEGGIQKRLFEFRADEYDENRHFFLAQYFRDNYNRAMSTLPIVLSNINITKVQVWVTNRRANPNEVRNVIAFADLAESKKIKNTAKWSPLTTKPEPFNKANNLYTTILGLPDVRNINKVTSVLTSFGLEGGQDFEKIENARLLNENEYFFNPQLGYISLLSALQPDEAIAVAYTYVMGGETYRVGELSSDLPPTDDLANPNNGGSLIVKLLRPASFSPNSYTWDLMMKNVYNLGSNNIQRENFKLEVAYKADSLGTFVNYLPNGGRIKDVPLIRVVGLDKLNAQNQPYPDGNFDFLEGYTIRSQTGRVYFPVVEPFGQTIVDSIKNTTISDIYAYPELYRLSQTAAAQVAERNKYYIKGYYRENSQTNEIDLNTMNIPAGSVVVMAAGVRLQENVDYIVDYTAGKVIIINQTLIDNNTAIEVQSEGRSFSMQRKTLMGFNLNYDFSKKLNVGATLMHYYEKPLIAKGSYGYESVKNTLWGLNASYRTESMWLTELVNKIPFVNASTPSQFAVNGEFAQMIGGHYQNKDVGKYSYIDDFEASEGRIDLKNPYAWYLSSTPTSNFPEGKLNNNIDYGKNRAQLAWFIIDPIFTRKNSSLTPEHIKYDLDQLSNHYVREVRMDEIYPSIDLKFDQSAILPTLNLSYYPEERGSYNLDADNVSAEGKLLNPQNRWGGMMRKMDVTDFEATNVEYIEFWLMDPFVYNDKSSKPNNGGKIYLNLGDISEDLLKDGEKSYENGLPLDGDPNAVKYTIWGKVPKIQANIYAYNDLDDNARKIQDVGLNGLSTAEELEYTTYVDYLNALRKKLSATTIQKMMDDPFSPFNDPGGDKYHYFRGSDYDRENKTILERYKYFNNTEGNNQLEKDTGENYSTAARSTPDVEDINQDFTLNENESFYQYEIDLNPNKMNVGDGYIVNKREVKVKLRNNTEETITWYQFKVPLKDPRAKKFGTINDFRSIRFMRLFLSGFKEETFLRFATFHLVRGEWRAYTLPLNDKNILGKGVLDVSSINIDESSERQPINYVLPPGLKRSLDPDGTQLTKENERSMVLQVTNLEPNDAKAVYKNVFLDIRQFKRLQMFTHLENVVGAKNQLQDGDLSVFLRLGSDYKDNYYEYEIPMSVTPFGRYYENSESDRQIVWPSGNMFDFPLELLKDTKLERNTAMRTNTGLSFVKPYSIYDPDKRMNKVTVMGNPSLGEVNSIMVGIRNKSGKDLDAIIWINELRLADFDDSGGWAVKGNAHLALSDVAVVDFSGHKETAGFGALEQSLLQRRQSDYDMYNISTSLDFGRFVPQAAKLSVPFSYSYSKEIITPKYDPFDTDVTLKESLSLVQSKAQQDSIKSIARDRAVSKSISFTNVRVNIASKSPMPYDPANFTFSYGYNQTEINSPHLTYDIAKDYRANLNYTYSPSVSAWEPFSKLKSNKGAAKFAKSIGINYLPSNISFNTTLTRHYTETLMRDIESYRLGQANDKKEFLSWSQSFFWDRNFGINWDFTRNLKFSFQSGTRAQIEEPYLQVNKKLNRSDYEIWRDEVWKSLKHMGTPYAYRQTVNLTYQLPFKNIPALNFMTSTAAYSSAYNWDRGVAIDEYDMGNSMTSNMTLDLNNRMNMLQLYNKSSYLKKINDRFDNRRTKKKNEKRKKPAIRPFSTLITLKSDTGIIVTHNLKSKKIDVRAVNNKKDYKLKFKKLDDNRIYISNKDSIPLNLNISVKEESDETTFWTEFRDHSARALMTIRSFDINYSKRNETYVTGFKPMVGDVFGQNSTDYGYAPGIGFALGLDGGEDYIRKIDARNWLLKNSYNINPAIYNTSEKFEARALLEPFKGFKINLNFLREANNRTEIQYMFDGMPKVYGGSFTMTTVAIGSFGESSKATNNYYSKSFQKFLDNRMTIANRINQSYGSQVYPSGGFMNNYPGLIGQPFDPTVGSSTLYSSDVLIPAFIAAYTGKSVNSVSLNPFPTLKSILPNWNVAYDALAKFDVLKNKFRTIQLTHAYQSFYQVLGYNSFSDWIQTNKRQGFIQDPLTGNPIPSMGYDISSVTITESFNPLFGVNTMMNSGLIFTFNYNTLRALNLNISSAHIVETHQKEIAIGGGYRFNEFNRLIGLTTQNSFNNQLTLKLDVSSKSNRSLIRKIEDNYTDVVSQNSIFTLMFSIDYTLSRMLSVKAFYDRVVNSPLVSATSYPVSTSNFGFSLRYNLTQ